MKTNIALLIYSWDNSSILWKTTVTGLHKYWPEIPYPIYWVTNQKDAPLGTTIKTGTDTNWGVMMQKALAIIPEKVVMWTCEDFWLTGPIDNDIIRKYADYIKNDQADYIKLTPSYEGTIDAPCDSSLQVIPEGAIYRTSLGPSIWNKDLFQQIIEPSDTVWHFENHSAKRLSPEHRMYASKGRYFLTPVIDGTGNYKEQIQRQGKVVDEMAKLYCQREGFEDYDI